MAPPGYLVTRVTILAGVLRETPFPTTNERRERRAIDTSRMKYMNNIGPQVRRRRYALNWLQQYLAIKLQLAGRDVSRSGVSKIEARLCRVDDRMLLYLAEALNLPLEDLFPRRPPGVRLHNFLSRLQTTRL